MKKINTAQKFVRATSILIVPVCFSIKLFCNGSADWVAALACAFLCADYLSVLYPYSSSTKPFLSVLFAMAAFLSVSLSSRSAVVNIPLYLSAGWTFLYFILRYIGKFSDLKPLFKNDAPMSNLEDFSAVAHFSFVTFFSLLFAAGAVWLSLVLSALSFAVLFLSACHNRLPALSRERELSVRDIIKGDLRSSPYVVMDIDSRMNTLYSRVVEYMEVKQPFLRDDFSLGEMSVALFTNKSYLSRVINYYSGRNFKQFVNYYRIKYAVDLIRKDPRLSVFELATMSGFHSSVTFNVAFRLNMNETPGSFCRSVYA